MGFKTSIIDKTLVSILKDTREGQEEGSVGTSASPQGLGFYIGFLEPWCESVMAAVEAEARESARSLLAS